MKLSQTFVDHTGFNLEGVEELMVEAVSVGRNIGLVVSKGEFEVYDLMFGFDRAGLGQTWTTMFLSMYEGDKEEFQKIYAEVVTGGPRSYSV